ncbi:MAG: hypothetical protein R3236_06040 [Phycisphaeraceae bacterium]|nr:hypothetical protein [Phycisphaeraceae bacterium]
MNKKNFQAMCSVALLICVGSWALVAQDRDGTGPQIQPEDVDVDKVVDDVADLVADELDRADRGEPADPEARRAAWRDRIQAWRKRAEERANLRRYDRNNDGRLDEDEKAQMAADKAAAEKAEKEKLAAARKKFFETYDTDKSGTLTADELAAAKKKIGAMIEHLNMVVVADEAMTQAKEPILKPLVSQIRTDLKVNPDPRRMWRNFGGRNNRDGGRGR